MGFFAFGRLVSKKFESSSVRMPGRKEGANVTGEARERLAINTPSDTLLMLFSASSAVLNGQNAFIFTNLENRVMSRTDAWTSSSMLAISSDSLISKSP